MLSLNNYFEISIFDLKTKNLFTVSSVVQKKNLADARQTPSITVIYDTGRKCYIC